MEIGGPLKQPHVSLENDQFKKLHVAHLRDIFWEDSLCFIDPQIRIHVLCRCWRGAAFFLGADVPRAVTRLNPTRASWIASIRQRQNNSTILAFLDEKNKGNPSPCSKDHNKNPLPPRSPKTSPHHPSDSSPLPPPPPPPP